MNPHSTVLQTSNKTNMFHPQQTDMEPRLEITEQPKQRGFRFRYPCEGPSHGGVPGAGSDKNKKTYPAVRIVNYQGYARIVVQLVTNEENPRLHPHSLVGKQCQNGICTVQCGPKDMTSTFPNLGIQHEKRKNVAKILEDRYVAAEMQLSSINDGFPQEVQRNIKEEDRNKIADKAQNEAKSIDLSTVRLMFIAYLPDSNGAFTTMLKPVISETIFDSKAPNASTLKICRMDCNSGSACGGDEVYLLCDKVQKDDIQVRFYQEDQQGNEVWEGMGNFNPTDVHRQYAIVFRTPPYLDQSITNPVQVNVQLKRRSDGDVSEPRQFIYVPNKDDYEMIGGKRRKITPNFTNHARGGSGFVFRTGVSNTNSGMFAQGANGNQYPLKEARPPPIKQEDPQKMPLDPTMLFKINYSIKQEPKSPNSNEFGSRHSSYQSSSPFSAGSPMSESLSPPAPSPPSEPEYITGTRIPLPMRAKMRTNGLPGINLSQPATQTPTAMSTTFQTTQVQTQKTTALAPEYVAIQEQQMQVSAFVPSEDSFDSVQFIMQDSPNSGAGASPIGDADPAQAYSNSGSWANLEDVQTGQFLANSYDQNHNPMQANPNDIVNQAFSGSVTGSESLTGPGSGSFGMSTQRDPLMPTPINTLNDINFNLLAHQMSLSELGIGDILDDIESDAGRETKIPGIQQEYDFGSAIYDTEITGLSTVVSDAIPQIPAVQADGDMDIESDSMGIMLGIRNVQLVEEIFDKETPLSQHMATKELKPQLRKEEQLKTKPAPKNIEEKPAKSQTYEKENVEDKAVATQKTTAMEKHFKLEEARKTAAAIHDYSVTGDIRMLLILQRHLASSRDDNGDTAIHVAVIHDQLEALSSLLDVVETVPESEKILNSVNRQRQTALLIATLTDNTEAVTDLLRAGADPMIADKKGNNSLHVACRHGNPDILRRLLESRQCRRQNIDVQNHIGFGLFHQAVKAKKNNRQCLKLLNEAECDVNLAEERSGRTPLHMAVETNNIVVAGCLISECDADLDLATYDGYTPLHIAAANNCIEIAALLLACGAVADLSTCCPEEEGGETPLDLARTDKMRDILSGKNILNDVNCDSLLKEDNSDVDDVWWSLDQIQRDRLCNFLNAEKTGCDWIALADKLNLRVEKSMLKNTENPTNELIKSYSMHHGSCDGLRSALMGIGRHDAVQVLNKALNRSTDSTLLVPKDVEALTNEDRFDSAIGSMPL